MATSVQPFSCFLDVQSIGPLHLSIIGAGLASGQYLLIYDSSIANLGFSFISVETASASIG